MKKLLTPADIRTLLNRRVKAAGSQKAFAASIGISPQYLNDVLQGKREPGEKMLKGMGMRRVVFYEEDS